ncbi:hypothetical protein K492DRAFT_176003 [Lichtheimia hyalospora FSU 10163]|nr:hypothetical protein K492DRAFT_176003 [Lichtheimia hyalospora FSU 10163]
MEESDILPSLVKSKNKFVIGGDDSTALPSSPPPTNSATNNTRRSHRHHVKRRSVGHVKMRPLSRVHSNSLTDTEAEADDGKKKRAPLRRSQSHRSLRVEGSLNMTISTTPIVTRTSTSSQSKMSDHSSSSNPSSLHVSQGMVAQPIAQMFHATANNIVVPEPRAAYSAAQIISSSPRSYENSNNPSSSSSINHSPRRRRRILLRSQFLTPDHDPVQDPVNQVDSEYRLIREYQDPMIESLVRCMLRKRRINMNRTMSSSAVHQMAPTPIHTAQRVAAKRHHSTLSPRPPSTLPVTTSPSNAAGSGLLGIRWSTATSLWDRMMRST